jgi:hypothetical protein
MHLPEIRGSGEDFAARIERIDAKAIAGTQLYLGIRHNPHQPHRSLPRNGPHFAGTLLHHDSFDPKRRYAEAPRRLSDNICKETCSRFALRWVGD